MRHISYNTLRSIAPKGLPNKRKAVVPLVLGQGFNPLTLKLGGGADAICYIRKPLWLLCYHY